MDNRWFGIMCARTILTIPLFMMFPFLFLSPPCYIRLLVSILCLLFFSAWPHHLPAFCIVLFNEEIVYTEYLNWEGVTDLLWFAVIHPLWVWIICVTLNLKKWNAKAETKGKIPAWIVKEMGEIKYSMSVFISQFLLSAQSPKQLKVHLKYIFYRFMHSLQIESMTLALLAVHYFNPFFNL